MSLKNSYPIGISLPKEVIKKIDAERLDVPRSRYILRLIENVYKKEEKKNITTDNKRQQKLLQQTDLHGAGHCYIGTRICQCKR
jgi:metal-responsive CopG/Arc/MetJ family transcriptional regulator